jgi:hypothetical protein
MLKSTLATGALALLLLNLAPTASASEARMHQALEPAINGEVSRSGLFPTQDMEEAFHAYLDWTKANGLSRLAAFEPVQRDFGGDVTGDGSLSGRFPNQEMEDQFKAYLNWTAHTDAELFYAFRVTNFD